ncbi:MAG: aminotransferase class III-fold pyridoxal phosphate-dependent enzyme, partial [Candidatus Aenigmarchaeota archaeon]|nr:aminotransferase class III-fold pyridoxal phosphate-dependent enzyme [Candidatus Aenigmarchaeota archaeon]
MAEELWLVDEKSNSRLLRKLKALHGEYSRKKRRSRKLFAEAKKHMPGGVASNLRYFPPFPLFFTGARGSRARDADGMEYVDYNLSYGAMLLGHNHPYVARKAARTIAKYGSTNFGAPIELASEMAGRLASIFPCAEMSRFCQSGTEAVMHSVRIARGYTGKP